MEQLNKALGLLNSIIKTMDMIQITGIENQDRFVGCANAVKNVEKLILDYQKSCEADVCK